MANETRQFVDNGPEPGEFLEDNYEDLLGYAASHARNWEDARDAVQDVIVNMLKYHQANGRLCPIDRNPVAYWKTSIANYIYGEHRRRSRQGKLSRRLFSPPDDFTEDILDNLIAKEGLEFIGTLNGRDHQIATMRWGEGLTPKQIAQKLGLNANSVRVSLYRTRKKMRIRLGIVGEPPQVLSKETT